MMLSNFKMIIFLILLYFECAKPNSVDSRLINKLLREYDKSYRPVFNQSQPIKVKIGLRNLMLIKIVFTFISLFQITFIEKIFFEDELDNKGFFKGILELSWNDEFLRWDKSNYSDISEITLDTHSIWLPDIVLLNNAGEHENYHEISLKVTVNSNGMISLNIELTFEPICKIDLLFFPFDVQTCQFMFGSYLSENKTRLELDYETIKTDSLQMNRKWNFISSNTYKDSVLIPHKKNRVVFEIKIKRKLAYYIINIFIPSLFLAILGMISLIFFSPSSSERILVSIFVMVSTFGLNLLFSEFLCRSYEQMAIASLYLMLLTLNSFLVLVFVMAIKYSISSSLIDVLPKRLKDFAMVKLFKDDKTSDLEYNETEKNIANILNGWLIKYVFFFDVIAFILFFILLPVCAIISQ